MLEVLQECGFAFKYATAFCFQSNAKKASQDYQEAPADCADALTLDPKDTLLLCFRGDAKFGLEDSHGAVTDCTDALKPTPKTYVHIYIYI